MGGGAKKADPTPKFAEEQQPFITPIFEDAQSAFDKIQGTTFGGALSAFEPTKQTNQGLASIESVGQGAFGAGTGARSSADILNERLKSGSSINSLEKFNPAPAGDIVNQAIQAAVNPIQQRLQEQILPGLESQAISGGAFGGSKFQDLQGRALRDFNREAIDAASRLGFTDLSQIRDLTAKDITSRNQLLPQLLQTDIAGAQAASGLTDKGLQQDLFAGNVLRDVGGQLQGVEQARIDEAIAQFNLGQGQEFDQIQRLANIILGFGPSGGGGGVRSAGGGGIKGGIAGGLGGAASGFAVGGPIGAGVGGLLGAFGGSL